MAFKEKLKEIFGKGDSKSKMRLKVVFDVFLVLACSYTLASVVIAYLLPTLVKPILSSSGKKAVQVDAVSLQGRPNFREIIKGVEKRNIFNDTGEFPVEDLDEDEVGQQKFDLAAPCSPTRLPITLTGTIYTGDGGMSLAIIQEKGVQQPDIYKVGDTIIDHEEAQIVTIGRNKIVINNNGVKECIEIEIKVKGKDFKKAKKAVEGISGSVTLQSAWVVEELGDGYAKIVSSARLVPNSVKDRVEGYKVFAIKKGTLLDKIGLKDGDIIKQVNETVMMAENGFALYQALMDEQEVKVLVGRGETPVTLNVKIKN